MKLPEGIPRESVYVNCSLYDLDVYADYEARRLYLNGEIKSIDEEDCDCFNNGQLTIPGLVKAIFDYNRLDRKVPIKDRKPIILYINSPGGDVTAGFSLLAAIKVSRTPIYTVNVGMWCSMAFWIGIAGTKRFTLPYMTFLMHEASGVSIGKISNMADKIKFDSKFNDTIIKPLVLERSNMSPGEYDNVAKSEFYMLPDDALKYGFIDEIVTDINAIL